MAKTGALAFRATLHRPARSGTDDAWTFLVLPKAASDRLPRRGRTSVQGTLNGHPFLATLEPDGQLGHWLKVSEALRGAAGLEIGSMVSVDMVPAKPEPEPVLPDDLRDALALRPRARSGWEDTTTIARLDWIHWIESAKQLRTRERRVADACDMLASGKKRVCCFDPSGYYSKSFGAPQAAG